jgi:hypothetical protein
MPKKDAEKRRGPGRPPKGKIKMTFKLAPHIATALEKARDMTGRGKSQLAEEALSEYLHLGTQEPPLESNHE